jgi:6,7-dimethyl-8-ribityllumazine synthase
MRREHYAKYVESRNASRLSVCIVVSRFNADITEKMLEGALDTLRAWRVKQRNIRALRVSGSFEIPYGCFRCLQKRKRPDAIVTIGCIIKGETKHDEYLASAVSHGLTQLVLEYGVPISFGIITVNTLQQARARSRGVHNKGAEAARAALESALLS